MATQYSIHPAQSGLSGVTAKRFAINGDTVLATASTVAERTNALGQWLVTFVGTAITGDTLIILFDSDGEPLSSGERTFTGTDGETATQRAVELDSTARVKLAAEQPDYTPATSAALAAMRGADNDTLKTLSDQIDGIEGGGGGGSATLEKQEEILTAIQGSQVIQVPSPNVQGNLVLTQGDSYDGIANPKASWTVTTDYTDGWSVTLTIRDADDAVIYTTSGTVVSVTVIAVQIDAPTGLTMIGCPGQWQGKFDVELTKAGSKKTIALGVCYINEDQTR